MEELNNEILEENVEQDLIENYNGELVPADSVTEEEKARIIERYARVTEENALKPTVEDLAEALDILTNIVLGGE